MHMCVLSNYSISCLFVCLFIYLSFCVPDRREKGNSPERCSTGIGSPSPTANSARRPSARPSPAPSPLSMKKERKKERIDER